MYKIVFSFLILCAPYLKGSLLPAKDSNSKFLILTHYTENIKAYAEAAIANQKAYAQTFGYQQISETGIISDEFSDPENEVPLRKQGLYWQKIAALEKAFNNPSLDFDWILWIDSDAVFTNFDQDLSSLVEKFGKGKDLLVPLDASNRAIQINNGVFFIRNSDWSRSFIRTVAAMHPLYKNDGTPEQDAMRDLMYSQANGSKFTIEDRDGKILLERDSSVCLAENEGSKLLNHTVVRHRGASKYTENLLDSHVVTVNQKVMNSFWRNIESDRTHDAQWTEGDFVMHVSNLPSEERAIQVKKTVNRVAEQHVLDETIRSQFKNCTKESLSPEKIQKILIKHPYSLHVTIRDGNISAENLWKMKEEKTKAEKALELLRRSQMTYQTFPEMEFVINLLDEHSVPIDSECEPLFSFGSESGQFRDFLFPFPFTFEDLGPRLRDMRANTVPYGEKIEKLVWRGTQTSGQYTKDNWRSKARSKLVIWCENHENICDAGFSGFSRQVDEDAQIEIEKAGLIKDRISEPEMQKYKYIASLDGNAWADRLARLLASNSLVLKQESDEVEFWYPLLKPYVHYLPLRKDLSDLEEQLAWAKTHEDECKCMIQNANRLVEDHLSQQKIDRYIFRLLQTFSYYQNGEEEDYPELQNILRLAPKDSLEDQSVKEEEDTIISQALKDLYSKEPHKMHMALTKIEAALQNLAVIESITELATASIQSPDFSSKRVGFDLFKVLINKGSSFLEATKAAQVLLAGTDKRESDLAMQLYFAMIADPICSESIFDLAAEAATYIFASPNYVGKEGLYLLGSLFRKRRAFTEGFQVGSSLLFESDKERSRLGVGIFTLLLDSGYAYRQIEEVALAALAKPNDEVKYSALMLLDTVRVFGIISDFEILVSSFENSDWLFREYSLRLFEKFVDNEYAYSEAAEIAWKGYLDPDSRVQKEARILSQKLPFHYAFLGVAKHLSRKVSQFIFGN